MTFRYTHWHRLKAALLGQASMEYLIVCAALAFALGVGMSDSNSVLWKLLEAFKTGYQKFTFAISIPT